MNKQKYWPLLSISIFTGLVLVSCNEPGSLSPAENIPTELPVSYSRDQIQTSANCMLQDYGRSLGEWVGENKRQCTDLARLLTNASGYGLDADKTALGGYEYIQTKEAKGTHIPTLREVNGPVERCDNLVITGKGFASVGHTVVVYSVDPTKDTIYYLDQNYGSTPEPISFRELDISDNQDNVYVIRSTCKTPTAIPTTTNAGSKCTQIPIQSLDIIDPITSADENQPISLGKIVFVSNRDGNDEIYVMNEDGSDQMNLSNNNATDLDPTWSPDGSKVLFTSHRDGNDEIYVMNADGSRSVNLSNNSATDSAPAWSPDGSKILFESNRDGKFEIYVMNADGSNQIMLTKSEQWSRYPKWSPKGLKIVFLSGDEMPLIDNIDAGYDVEISVMNADGSQLLKLTNNDTWDLEPVWSPDGNKIAFIGSNNENTNIFVVDARSGDIFQLTDFLSSKLYLDWSPDGSKIIFDSNDEDGRSIYLMNADGSDQEILFQTNNGAFLNNPLWSPNGTKIMFEERRTYIDGAIYAMNSDGSVRNNLTLYSDTNATVSRDPDWWSPESTH